MGILDFVSNEHAGIIPRAMAQIFEDIANKSHVETTVTLSFLQLYRETIQDLLAPASGNNQTLVSDDNLAISEDPIRGFYVEGLQEFIVQSYSEAGSCANSLFNSIVVFFISMLNLHSCIPLRGAT